MAGRAAQDVPNPAQEALDLVGVDPRRALDVAEALGTAARSRRDVASASAADRAAGLALRETGRLVEAERRLRRAAVGASRTGAAQAEAEARMSLAFLLLERGKARSALHEADRAAGALHGVAAARLESQRALVLQRTGRLAEALAAYRRALRVLRRDGDRLWEARALNNRALLLAYQGSLTSARSDLLRARSLHEELGLTSFVADTDWNLGFVAGRAGEVPAALAAFDRAEASYATRGAVHPQLLIDRAEVLLAAGLHHEALATARRAVARVEAAGAGAAEPEGLLLLAQAALAAGEAQEAARAAGAARAAFTRQGRHGWARLGRLLVLRADAERGVSPDRLLVEALACADELAEAGWRIGALDARLVAADAARLLGRHDVARQQLTAAAAARRSTSLALQVRARLAEAELRVESADRLTAMRAARAGLRAVHRRQAVLGATDLRVSTARYGERLGALGVSLALDGGHPRTVLAWAERSRAGSVVRRALPPEDPAYTAALVELRRRSHDLVDAQLSGEPTAALRAAAARAERAVVAASRSAHGSGASSSDGEVSPSELVVALADRALVEYVRDGSELYAVTVVSGRWRLVPLGAVDPISRLADQVGFGLRRAASVREPGTVTLTGTAAGGGDGAGTGAVSAGEAGGSGGVDQVGKARAASSGEAGGSGEVDQAGGARAASSGGPGEIDQADKARAASSREAGQIDQTGKARAASSGEAGGSGGVDAAGEEGAREGLRSDSMSGEGDGGGKARVANSGEAGGSGEVGEGLARVVRAGVDGATADAARLLEERLLGPLGDLGERDLVVIPTGVLHSVAWGALPRLEHRPVTVAPSARAWLRAQRAMPSRDRHARTVVVAGPGLPGAAKEVARLGVAYRAIGSSGRPTTTPEGADTPWDTTAPARHTTEALDGTDATVHRVLLALDGADTAHIAAHGILRADNPQFSALELVDGPLTVYDLERLRTPPRLMVLPACRSGVHAVLAGDEVMGLVASLLAMGTADVIAPVAVVDDAATTEVMVALHERLRAGDRPDVALAAVRFAVSGASPAARAAAAAFTCHGG